MKFKIEKGDYIIVDGLSREQYERARGELQIAKVKGGSSYLLHHEIYKGHACMGWGPFRRKLTITQVLDDHTGG